MKTATKTVVSLKFGKTVPSCFDESRLPKNNVLMAREVQEEAMAAMKDAMHNLLLAPTGCGKSKAVASISDYQHTFHGVRKTVIVVPRTSIGKSYRNFSMLFKGVGVIRWKVEPEDFLTSQTTPTEVKTKGVLNFLRSKSPLRVNLVCSYPAFIAACKHLAPEERLALFDSVMLCIDECHHLSYAKNGEKEEFNDLGMIVDDLISTVPSFRSFFVTATYCRGDLASILSPKTFGMLTAYEYSYERYFRYMQYLKSFEYRFATYQRKRGAFPPAAIITEIFDSRNVNTIIYIPNVNSHCSHGKTFEVSKILENLGSDQNGCHDYPEDSHGLIHIVRPDGTKLKIINLVDEKRRKAKKTYLDNISDSADLDIIIALDMCKEGFDWVYAERAIVVGYRGSIVEILQIPGRLFRDIPGKKEVEVVHLLEDTLGMDIDSLMVSTNRKLNAIIGAMLMEEIYDPISVPAIKKNGGEGGGSTDWDPFRELIPLDKRQDFLASVFEESMLTLDPEAEGDDVLTFRKNRFDGIVKNLLDASGFLPDDGAVDETVAKVSEKCWRILARDGMMAAGLDKDSTVLDLVWRINPVGSMRHLLVTDKMGVKTFEAYRQALHRNSFTTDEYLTVAEEIYRKHGSLISSSLPYEDTDVIWGR